MMDTILVVHEIFDQVHFFHTVETVCALSKLSEAKHHISVQVDMGELDVTAAESKATYEEIQEWVQEKYGFHVTHLNIAKTKPSARRPCKNERSFLHGLFFVIFFVFARSFLSVGFCQHVFPHDADELFNDRRQYGVLRKICVEILFIVLAVQGKEQAFRGRLHGPDVQIVDKGCAEARAGKAISRGCLIQLRGHEGKESGCGKGFVSAIPAAVSGTQENKGHVPKVRQKGWLQKEPFVML